MAQSGGVGKGGGRLQNRSVLITGAAQGLGRESAKLFAREGANLTLADCDAEGCQAAAAEAQQLGARAIAVAADVAQSADCARMVAAAETEFGALHVLFNNAGVMDAADADAISTDEQVWERTMQINLKGVYLGCKHGIPALRRAGGGAVINTASFVAVLGAATPQLAYTASKGGVLALSRELAVVHAREGIRVNALCPGPLRTKLLMQHLNTPAKQQRRLVHIPMGRFGEAAEVARAALFLAGEDSSYMTGAALMVDGGLSAAYVTPEN